MNTLSLSLTKFSAHQSWDKYMHLYFALRKNEISWLKFENQICDTINYLCQGNFRKHRNLNKCLPVRQNELYLIENILIARRIIFSQIFFCQGQLHEVETFLGYEEEKSFKYHNPYRIYNIAFRKYCNTLAIRPAEFCKTGDGLLAEEEEWLVKYCVANELTYGFPILP